MREIAVVGRITGAVDDVAAADEQIEVLRREKGGKCSEQESEFHKRI